MNVNLSRRTAADGEGGTDLLFGIELYAAAHTMIRLPGLTNGTFVHLNANVWEIRHSQGTETLTFANAAPIHATDYQFIP